jgi:hypothetical protein
MCHQKARHYGLNIFNIHGHPERMNDSGGPAPFQDMMGQIARAEMYPLGYAYVGFTTYRYNLTS